MMPDLPLGWHLVVLASSLSGFFLLALTSEREGEVLLRRPVTRAEKTLFRVLGWAAIGFALYVCMRGWFAHFGTVLWLGWLTVAAVVLVFGIAYWPWREATAQRRAMQTRPVAEASLKPAWLVGIGYCALVVAPLALGWLLWHAEPWPVLRADAVHGKIGPWQYRLAEEERDAPEVIANGAAVKYFVLQFEGDELAVARAWLRVQPPRSLRTSGMSFVGRQGNREAMIVIPRSATSEDAFWLTVQGKDGQVYRTSIEMSRLSPETAEFVEAWR